MRFALPLGLAFVFGLAAPSWGAVGDPLAVKQLSWSFDGVFGTYNETDLQHGFQVYKEVCSACHSLNRVAFHTLSEDGGPGFTDAQMKAIAAGYHVLAGPNDKGETTDDKGNPLTRAGTPADYFPPPFPNEEAARTANGGALPPDLSLIEKARAGGADYVYSLITGFHQTPPKGFVVTPNKYYNPYFSGWNVSMPPPLTDGQVTFSDGAPNKLTDEAFAVANFLAWTSEPHLDARHRIGVAVMAFMLVLSILLYLSYRQVWKDVH